MDRSQKEWLEFVRAAVEVPIAYSEKELKQFREIAQTQYPALVRVIESYIQFHTQSAAGSKSVDNAQNQIRKTSAARKPILDLLRDPRLFPRNATIASFAQRVLPGMRSYRFDKMSKGDIALRIVQYLETLDGRTRLMLEHSMREALEYAPQREEERESFLSKWEGIIKGMNL